MDGLPCVCGRTVCNCGSILQRADPQAAEQARGPLMPESWQKVLDDTLLDNRRLRKELEEAKRGHADDIDHTRKYAADRLRELETQNRELVEALSKREMTRPAPMIMVQPCDHEATISKLKLNLEAKEQFNRGLETQLCNTENRVKAFWEAEHTWYKRELWRRDPKLVERHEAGLAAERERGRGR